MRQAPSSWLSLLALLTVLPAAAGAGEPLALELTVEEPAGLARKAEPVSAGIPLPPGTFKKDQAFALFEGDREVPVQVLPLVVEADGTLRWILLDFQTDLGGKERKTFTLKSAGPAAKPTAALSMTEDAGGVTVDTGKVKFTVAKSKPFSLISSAEAGGKPVLSGGEASYVDGFSGKRYVAGQPESVVVEYAGPLRATVCVKGRFDGDDESRIRYIARLTAWAGRSDVHVKYSIANSNPDHYCYRQVSDSTVTMKLAAAPASTLVGADRAVDGPAECWLQQSSRAVPAVCHSHDSLEGAKWARSTPGGCRAAGADGKAFFNDKSSEGWIAARSGDGTVWVADLYFTEDPPRRLEVRDGSLLLVGVTEPLEDAAPPFGEKTRWLFDCSHLSSQYLLDLAAPAEGGALSAAARSGRARLWAFAPPAWYFDTEALPVGRFGTQGDELTCYKTWGWEYEESEIPKGPAGQTAKIERWTAADDNHFTSEQDTADALLLMYLRTGRRSFFDAAESWVNYFMDLQMWRTDGWRWKDGGVWWHGGPAGNRPQRAEDPVTGLRNSLPAEWAKTLKTKLGEWGRERCRMISFTFLAKSCKCHNWGEGLAEWFLLTGDRDAYEAAVDAVELNYDAQGRAGGKAPGKASGYSRDFTRSCYLTNTTRLIAPTDEFVIEASNYLADCYLKRPDPEPRGLVNGPGNKGLPVKEVEKHVGKQGIEEMNRLGVKLDEKTGTLTDPKSGASWKPIVSPHTWMFPPLCRAMDTYHGITGSEDAADWLIAYGQAAARVLYQPKHGNLYYGRMLADFPLKGVVKDYASWLLPEEAKDGEGVPINGYLAQFYPDVPARAYSLCGEPLLKQRAYDYWYYGSHRGYNSPKMTNVGRVGVWVNLRSTHHEFVCFTGRTFYIHSHPRKDEEPPAAVTDLAVALAGKEATVSFTAPADAGGGKVTRYQVKCSDKPIVNYEDFLKAWSANTDAKVTNWWMAANLSGEGAPQAPGARESFKVSGVPEGARYFAVRSFDDSANRSALGSVFEAR